MKPKPKVYTYFDANLDAPDQGKTIRHWFLSWRKNGWDPCMLTPRTFSRHILRKRFLKCAKKDPDKLQAARAARWLAILALNSDECVTFSEYDVINYGFTPEDHTPVGGFCVSESGGFMSVTPWMAENLLANYLETTPRVMTIGLLPHSSLFKKWGWWESKLVHFRSDQVGEGVSKHAAIENCGRLY